MATYKTPGVYVEEVSIFPPSVAQVETAIPVFIGYTEKAKDSKNNDYTNVPTKIKSMVDYKLLYGGAANELPTFNITGTGTDMDPYVLDQAVTINKTPVYKMYYALQMYFANGGGPCYIVSVGPYVIPAAAGNISNTTLEDALAPVKKEDEPTLIVFPDLINIADDDLYCNVIKLALQQCADLGDRFVICDVKEQSHPTDPPGQSASVFRSKIGTSNLMYGAAYYPYVNTTLNYDIPDEEILVLGIGGVTHLFDPENEAASLFHANDGNYKYLYYEIKTKITEAYLQMPVSPAMAGVYAAVDSTRGVWKAPANVSLNTVSKPNVFLERVDQDGLNVDTSGKSINAIRYFTGNGTLVWGARTLDGNSNEWRYISVRRFFNMVEESVKKASEFFVFEPNDANTWIKVKAMIENFLVLQWRAGALMGAKADEAFFVKVGLGETMTEDDVLNGRLIVEIGMAVVRPAEFIILRFSHKMIEA
ncbi:MAG: phage tail sheath C-terminal domain-containing protein [Bacteroidota bacterium]